MSATVKFLLFLASVAEPLYELFEHVTSGAPADPEKERQLALAIVRKAKDEQAKSEAEAP